MFLKFLYPVATMVFLPVELQSLILQFLNLTDDFQSFDSHLLKICRTFRDNELTNFAILAAEKGDLDKVQFAWSKVLASQRHWILYAAASENQCVIIDYIHSNMTSQSSFLPWNGALYWASVTGSVKAAALVKPLSDPFIYYLCRQAAYGKGHLPVVRLLEEVL